METTHGTVLAISDDDGVTLVGENHDSVAVTKDQLIAIAAEHAAVRPAPVYGQSRFRSIDAHLVHQQAKVNAAEADLRYLRGRIDAEPHSPDWLVACLRAGIAALETGSEVTGDIPLYLFAGIHPAPGETLEHTVPVSLQIRGRA